MQLSHTIGIFNSPKYDINPQPNTRGNGPLVGRTSGNCRSVTHVLGVILSKTCHFFFICQYIFIRVTLSCRNQNISSLNASKYISYILVWFGLLRIYVALAVFQPYRDLEAGDNQSLKIQVARRGIEPRTSCSATQELNHSATAAPYFLYFN